MPALSNNFLAVCLICIATQKSAFAENNKILPIDIDNYSSFFNHHYGLAIEGNPISQLYVGALYEKGLGIQKDLILSHVYYNLASSNSVEGAKKHRNLIEKQLTKKEFATARKIAKLYKPGVGINHLRQLNSLNLKLANDTPAIHTKIDNQQNIINELPKNSDVDKYTRLFNATTDNDIIEIKNLIETGIDINYRYSNAETALMVASKSGDLNTVATLLNLGADPTLKSKHNKTAIDIARQNNHDYVVAILRTKTLALSELLKDIQVYLNRLEYDIGTVDGLYGIRTKNSLEQFSIDHGQNFPVEISQRQLDALKITYNSFKSSQNNELMAQSSLQQEDENQFKTINNKPTPKNNTVSDTTNDLSSNENNLTKIDKLPNITGTYNAKTVAVFSNCGTYNQTIQYYAEEAISNLTNDGHFEITYSAPLVNCSGKGKLTPEINTLTGQYDCIYKTTNTSPGTLIMDITGKISGNKIKMEYNGSDTTPGQTCVYKWKRTLTLLNK